MESETKSEQSFATERPEKFEQLYTVTPLSKYLALVLFILMPFLGGWIGYSYAPEKVVGVENRTLVQQLSNAQGQITYFNNVETLQTSFFVQDEFTEAVQKAFSFKTNGDPIVVIEKQDRWDDVIFKEVARGERYIFLCQKFGTVCRPYVYDTGNEVLMSTNYRFNEYTMLVAPGGDRVALIDEDLIRVLDLNDLSVSFALNNDPLTSFTYLTPYPSTRAAAAWVADDVLSANLYNRHAMEDTNNPPRVIDEVKISVHEIDTTVSDTLVLPN